MIINITSEAANDLSGRDIHTACQRQPQYVLIANNHLKEAGIYWHPSRWIRTTCDRTPPSAPITARNILDIIEGRIKVDDDLVFISHTGIGL